MTPGRLLRGTSEGPLYGPMLNAIQDMWQEHDERAQGGCGCSACASGITFFQACCEVGEAKR